MERKGNIITVEDPIEFMHPSKNCIVSQREIGKDAVSFAHALKAMLREDPDIILLGEMRDKETIGLALTAAETGHLVFGTLHTNGAANSINRIIDVFPSEQQAQIRSQLSQSLRLVVTQTLLRKADGSGRVAAFELMINTPAVSNLIRENKIFMIDQAIQTGRNFGMMTMEDSIKNLMMMGIINEDSIEK
jgi:twitching motility protein PilT